MPTTRSCAARLVRPVATPRSFGRRRRSAASVPVFQPQPAALAALASRVKESFDPKRLFNPGRMD